MAEDARRDAARYRAARDAGEPAPEAAPAHVSPSTREERAAFIETSIQQAIRSGEFDDLPGSGQPLTGLGGRMDPDWWIRRKIEREQLGGLGPPALTLRAEHAELDERLDRIRGEAQVREALEDFNRRVVEARRQLQGGPPVVTPTRDVDDEVRRWRQRRRQHAESAARAEEQQEPDRPTWRERRAARRSRRSAT